MVYHHNTPKHLYHSSAFEHLGHFQDGFCFVLFCFVFEMYTAMTFWHSDHIDPPLLLFLLFGDIVSGIVVSQQRT